MIALRVEDPSGVTLRASYDLDHQDSPDLLTGLSGWTGGVGVRRETLDRLSHGSFPTPTLRTGRTLTVDMMMERGSETELWDLDRGISGLWADGGYGTLTVATGHEEEISASVTLDGEPKTTVNLNGGYLTLQLPLWAPSPYLHGAWRETTLRPIDAGVGITYPLLAGAPASPGVLTFGSEVASEAYVWNDGNAPSFAEITVYADTPGGFRIGLGDGYVVWPRPTYADVPVTVNMAGYVSVSGVRQTQFSTERRWAPTAPGELTIPQLSFIQGGTGFATVRHRDTFI